MYLLNTWVRKVGMAFVLLRGTPGPIPYQQQYPHPDSNCSRFPAPLQGVSPTLNFLDMTAESEAEAGRTWKLD